MNGAPQSNRTTHLSLTRRALRQQSLKGMKSVRDRRQYVRERSARLRAEWLHQYGPCRSCGSSQNLEVDHIDRSTKVTNSVWAWGRERREAELSKCQVLCIGCHKLKTRTENSVARPHGTRKKYMKEGCRCQLCSEAASAHRQRYR